MVARAFLCLLLLGVMGLMPVESSASLIPEAGTTILVNTLTDELNNDGDCALREAIRAANLDAAVDACAAGSGADTIVLQSGVTYTLTRAGADDTAINRRPGHHRRSRPSPAATRSIDANGATTNDRVHPGA